MTRKIFIYLAIAQALSVVPLAFFLPFSTTALVFAIGILVALNASIISIIDSRSWSLSLQIWNLVVCGFCLALVFVPDRLSLWTIIVIIAALWFCLLALAFFRLPGTMLRACFAAQQLALASTLAFWILLEHFLPVLEVGQSMDLPHFRMGLRFLFSGPLALVAVVFCAGILGWKRYLTALAGVCAGQLAAGFFELGAALQAYSLVLAGFVFGSILILLLIVAAVSKANRRVAHQTSF